VTVSAPLDTPPITTARHHVDRAGLARRLGALLGDQQVLLLIALISISVYFYSRDSIFFSTGVFSNILLDWAPLVLLVIGETYVVISGGIDLSVGAALGFAGVIGAEAMKSLTSSHHGQTVTLLAGTLVCAAVGIGIGLFNAFLINRAKLVPFIATLATLGMAGGLTQVITKGAPIIGGPPNTITEVQPWIGPFSKPVLLVVAVLAFATLVLHKARFGRYTFAIGSNAFATRAAGINVDRHVTKVYALSGLMAGLAGMFFYLRLGSGAPSSGLNAELDAIAAVVIGGASLSGGIGKLTASALGAMLLATIYSGLVIINVPPDWKKFVVGALIALAATLQALRSSGRKSRARTSPCMKSATCPRAMALFRR